MERDFWAQVALYLGTYGVTRFAGNTADLLAKLVNDIPKNQRSDYADLVNALRRIVDRAEKRGMK